MKFDQQALEKSVIESLPSWERGLKYGEAQDETQDEASLPSWGRGLKSGTATAPGTAAAGRSPRGSVD